MKKRYHIIATAFDKKGKVLSSGVNEYHRSHPLFKYFAVLSGESDQKIYKHAEFSAIISAGNKEIHSLLVQRYDTKGNPMCAEPCKTCKTIIKHFGIKKVSWTSPEGIVESNTRDW